MKEKGISKPENLMKLQMRYLSTKDLYSSSLFFYKPLALQ